MFRISLLITTFNKLLHLNAKLAAIKVYISRPNVNLKKNNYLTLLPFTFFSILIFWFCSIPFWRITTFNLPVVFSFSENVLNFFAFYVFSNCFCFYAYFFFKLILYLNSSYFLYLKKDCYSNYSPACTKFSHYCQ